MPGDSPIRTRAMRRRQALLELGTLGAMGLSLPTLLRRRNVH